MKFLFQKGMTYCLSDKGRGSRKARRALT